MLRLPETHRQPTAKFYRKDLQKLSISSSVYEIYSTRQQKIQIVSRNVNSLFSVVKCQRDNGDVTEHLNQLFNSWTWQQGDDKIGFFMEFLLISLIKLCLEIPNPLFLISHIKMQVLIPLLYHTSILN